MAEVATTGGSGRNQQAAAIPTDCPGTLVLADGSRFRGRLFGARTQAAGEVVFNTGMVGYPESLTDPSYRGQILALTFPLVGNYGVPGDATAFESTRIHASGLVVATESTDFSHWAARESLSSWLAREGVTGITGVDTRALTRRLRNHGTMRGCIVPDGTADPEPAPEEERHVVAEVSTRSVQLLGSGDREVLLVDCGCKESIVRQLLARGVRVRRVPWDHDFTAERPDGILLSNGPGDPERCAATVEHVRRSLSRDIPIFGICLGNQVLALAAGGRTYKLKFGHRGHNQPVKNLRTGRCLVTSQNHSYAVDTASLPADWEPLYENLNDRTNEGIRHKSGRFFSVQFHPEAAPGPVDAGHLFDDFMELLRR